MRASWRRKRRSGSGVVERNEGVGGDVRRRSGSGVVEWEEGVGGDGRRRSERGVVVVVVVIIVEVAIDSVAAIFGCRRRRRKGQWRVLDGTSSCLKKKVELCLICI